jgi:SNF2 family DNA or RNA helicase
VQELETLLGICLPQIFMAQPIKQQFKYARTKEQRQQLQKLVSPFILRRTREQVLTELPECSEDIRVCELSEDQIEAYREAAEQARMVVDEYLDTDKAAGFTTILVTITRLKQICNHLCQLQQSTDYGLYQSGKWDEFIRLLEQCLESGLKVVVFSQFTAMLDIMEQWLEDTKISYVAIRGDVPAKERNKRVERFNREASCKICCASLLAGGTGIDLTGAQVVIHYDRWWNPAKEEQATARVYRMGQKHPVQVYKLVTAGTLEEKIHGLIEEKKALAADLLVEDDASILKTLSRDDLAGLFQFGM